MKKLNLALGVLAIGVFVCLTGAAIMAFGHGLIGENHAGIATVIGIVGIGIISTSGVSITTILDSKKKSSTGACAK